MPRVQGDQGAWKKHTPDGPGAVCCAPQVVGQNDFFPPQIQALTNDPAFVANLAAAQCGVDEPIQAVIYADPFGPGNPVPVINGPVVVVPGAPNAIQVPMDTTGALGNFLLELTNDCGCCTLVTGNVQ